MPSAGCLQGSNYDKKELANPSDMQNSVQFKGPAYSGRNSQVNNAYLKSYEWAETLALC
jgi:hypothetical protein